MTKVKVCGLMTAADIAIVNDVHPDFAGFILAGGRHHIDDQTLAALTKQLAQDITAVAVVVDPDVPHLIALHQAGYIQAVQLHHVSPASTIAALQAAGLLVIARINEATPQTPADFALLDAGDGSGQTLPWDQLPHVAQPLMLAGGLDGHNVQAAIQAVHPQIVDASSRLETAGAKDRVKVAAFVANARNHTKENN
ncbi:phosphoribosylanthranilate isomerase [Lacticaseibacillus jixiensis]|uniref:phosphoribosylanthranilate isomerase n=1 Tax=Lacticaseibacillus jixiensis TaxID=3231926 RepID=UPI0036F3BD9B